MSASPGGRLQGEAPAVDGDILIERESPKGYDTNVFNITTHCNYGIDMEMATTTISRNGQIVIPLAVRKALGIGRSEKFLVVGEGDTILLRRLSKDRMRLEFEAILDYFSAATAKAGLKPDDVEKEIKAHRAQKRRSHEGRG
jgi:AbrB family looped-hinge helix DNA binding protein